jgi:hypothetical protein
MTHLDEAVAEVNRRTAMVAKREQGLNNNMQARERQLRAECKAYWPWPLLVEQKYCKPVNQGRQDHESESKQHLNPSRATSATVVPRQRNC